jgi:hypothetical protein
VTNGTANDALSFYYDFVDEDAEECQRAVATLCVVEGQGSDQYHAVAC